MTAASTGPEGEEAHVPRSEALRRIRAKLDQLRAGDRDCHIFGAAAGHRYREAPPLDGAALLRLEGALGVTLPEELRAFLTHVHGGGPGPGYGLALDLGCPCPELAAQPFPYDGRAAAELLHTRRTDPMAWLPLTAKVEADSAWPPRCGFVALADLGCDIYSGIVVTGEQRGLTWTCVEEGWIPEAEGGTQLGFLGWYEAWLDKGLAQLGGQ